MKKYLITSSILLIVAFISAMLSIMGHRTLISSEKINKLIESGGCIQLKGVYRGLIKINYVSNCTQILILEIGNKHFEKYTNELNFEFIGELNKLRVVNNSSSSCYTKLSIEVFKVNMPYKNLALPAFLLLVIGIAILSIWFTKKLTT